MKEVSIGGNRFLLVEVPENAREFEMYKSIPNYIDYYIGEGEGRCDDIDLPKGNYELIGKADKLEGHWEFTVRMEGMKPETTLVLKIITNE